MGKSLLEGIRIFDLTATAAGPYGTTLLAFMGAEVIRVESSTYQDFMRVPGREARYYEINANKLGITLNLRHPEAVKLAKELVRISQVVTDAFRPGVMQRLGLDYERLKEVKPDIIAASLSGFGQTGPERHFASFAAIFAAMAGLSYITGYPDSGPTEIRLSADLRNGSIFAFAILAAIFRWKRTGQGQYIDYSAREGLSCLIGDVILDYSMNGRVQKGTANLHPWMAPHNCYPCRDNGWVSIAVSSEKEWESLCHTIGQPELIHDARFNTTLSRHKNQEELDSLVGNWTSNRSDYEVMEKLQEVGVAAMPSFSNKELHSDPHLEARRAFTKLDIPKIGKWKVLSPPWKFSKSEAVLKHPAPKLGEHNEYVFGELLGMSTQEIERLKAEKVIY